MTGDPNAQFIGSVPEHYDQGLGPHVFVDFGADLARRAAEGRPGRVLEIAAGTGIVTRLLRDALADTAALTATDLNPPMLAVARQKFADHERVDFQPADATDLPFDDARFDLLTCQFGLMFFPDRDRHYAEAHRVLAAGGRYLFNVWDSHAYNPFGRIALDTIARFFERDPPGFYRVPFSCHQIDLVKEGLLAAGFSELRVAILRLEKTIPAAERFARGIVYGNPVIDEITNRGTADPEQVVAAVTAALQAEFGADPGRMPLQAIVFDARKL